MTLPAERATVEFDRETFKALFSSVPSDGPVVMLNLLAFNDTATDGAGAPERTGRQAYASYSRGVAPLLERAGAAVQWSGDAHHALIAPPGEQWDEVLLVQYPSRDAFVAMIQSPDYQAIAHHRAAALRDSRLVATTPRD